MFRVKEVPFKICIIYRGGTHPLHGWTYIVSCTLTFIAI